VVVPVLGAPEPLVALYREYARPLREQGLRFGFVFVAGVGQAAALRPLLELAAAGEPVRVLESGARHDTAALLRCGLAATDAPVMVTLPCRRQAEAAVLPALVRHVQGGADMAVAWRFPRVDSAVNRWQHRVLQRLTASLSGGTLHDVACEVRAVRRTLLEELPLQSGLSDFLPLLALRSGHRVVEVRTPVHARAMSARWRSPGVYARRAVELVCLHALVAIRERPLPRLGGLGVAAGAAGVLVLGLDLLQRVPGDGGLGVSWLALALGLFALGIVLVVLAVVAQLVVEPPRATPVRVRSLERSPARGARRSPEPPPGRGAGRSPEPPPDPGAEPRRRPGADDPARPA